MTSTFMPASYAADTQAPVLISWRLIDSKTDISNGDGKLRVEFSISDESIVEDPLSSLSSQYTTQQSGFAFPTLISKVGNVYTYSAEATISFGKAPGLWRWILFPLQDKLGNTSSGFGPGGSWPVEVWVYDKDFTEVKRLEAELKAKQEAEAKAAAELKAKQEAEAKAAAELKAKQEAEAKAKANANKKKTTITCIKGQLTKKVKAINPKCPRGYKKR